jgi:predicted metal-binding membrane protein
VSASSPAEAAAGTGALDRTRSSVSSWLAWHPEWPLYPVVTAAWALLARHHLGPMSGHQMTATDPLPGMPPSPDMTHDMAGMAHGAASSAGTVASVATDLTHWSLMTVAMMLPLAFPAARHVVVNSFRQRRPRALAVFAVCFVLPWLALGWGLVEVADRFATDVPAAGLAAVLLLVAALWQVSPWKLEAVLSCSRTVPLPPAGIDADRACAWFGLRQSLRCLAACAPLMAVMVVAVPGPWGLVAMAAASAFMLAETRSLQRARLVPLLAWPLLLAAALTWWAT